MKKLFAVVVLLFVVLSSFGQAKFERIADEMTGKSFIVSNYKFVVSNESKTEGFILDPTISTVSNEVTIISTQVFSGTRCCENDELIILLTNGEKITLNSWKKFNCEGTGYFNLNEATIKKLKSSPISKIRLTNGRTYKSYTGEPSEKYKTYFVEILNSTTLLTNTNVN